MTAEQGWIQNLTPQPEYLTVISIPIKISRQALIDLLPYLYAVQVVKEVLVWVTVGY